MHDRKMTLLGWGICLLAALFYTYEYLLRIEPSMMVPQIMQYYHITAQTFGFVTALYYYAYTPLQAIVGVLTDYYGPKWALTTALCLCVLGSFVYAYTDSIVFAGLGRFLIGAGSAFAFVGVLKLAAMWIHRDHFTIFVGLTTALGMLGAMIGDIEISHAISAFGWHHVLIGSAFIGVALIPIFWFIVSDRHIEGYEQETFAAVWAGFKRVFASRQLWICGIVGSCMYLSLSVFAELWGIPFLHSMEAYTKTQASQLNAMVFLGWLIGAPFSGIVSNLVRSRRLPIAMGGFLAAVLAIVAIYYSPMPFPVLALYLFLFGFFSSAQCLVFVVAHENVELKSTASAIGFVNLLIMAGGMIFQPTVGALLDAFWVHRYQHGVPFYTLSNFRGALLFLPIAMLLAGILSCWLKETYHLRRAERHEAMHKGR